MKYENLTKVVGFTSRNKPFNGFTLIELLVVISLIGILASLLIVSLQGSRASARDGRRKADLEQIRTALEMYRRDSGSYPATTGSMATYLPQVPVDPLSPPSSPIPYPYTPGSGGYVLCALLENGSGTVSGCGACGTSTCNYKVTNP
jgi:general secretion pathway protein G